MKEWVNMEIHVENTIPYTQFWEKCFKWDSKFPTWQTWEEQYENKLLQQSLPFLGDAVGAQISDGDSQWTASRQKIMNKM